MAKKQTPTKKSAKKPAAKKSRARAAAGKKSTSKSGNRVGTTIDSRSSPQPGSAQIQLKQSSEYRGNDQWNWSVWVDAPSAVLDEIEYVDYMLHSTFDDPLRHKTNRQEKFRLDSGGWGEFTIHAEIKQKNGNRLKKTHWLTLDYPQQLMARGGGTVTAKEKAGGPVIYLCAGLSDLRMGNALAESLRKKGMTVLKADELPPSELPWDVAISAMIKAADLMVVLLSGSPTRWMTRGIEAALDRKLEIVPIIIGPDPIIPEDIQRFQAINLKEANEPNKIAPNVATQIVERIKTLPQKRA